VPPGDIDKIAKRMRSRFAGNLGEELAQMPEFASRLKSAIWQDFFRLVQELRGFPRHLSQHSGGVIISTTRIDEQVPVERPAMAGRYICQWDKDRSDAQSPTCPPPHLGPASWRTLCKGTPRRIIDPPPSQTSHPGRPEVTP
jgi:DNA polymerase III alpha subunit